MEDWADEELLWSWLHCPENEASSAANILWLRLRFRERFDYLVRLVLHMRRVSNVLDWNIEEIVEEVWAEVWHIRWAMHEEQASVATAIGSAAFPGSTGGNSSAGHPPELAIRAAAAIIAGTTPPHSTVPSAMSVYAGAALAAAGAVAGAAGFTGAGTLIAAAGLSASTGADLSAHRCDRWDDQCVSALRWLICILCDRVDRAMEYPRNFRRQCPETS